MSFVARFKASAVFKNNHAKGDFETRIIVWLRDWDQWENAMAWCERHWETLKRPYRRRFFVDERKAKFEFPCDDDGVEFLLKYGERAERSTKRIAPM